MVTELTPAVKRGLAPVGLRLAHLLPFKAARCSLRIEGCGLASGDPQVERGWGEKLLWQGRTQGGDQPHTC